MSRSFPEIEITKHDHLGNVNISINEVAHTLSNLDINKAMGPDALPARILKECANELAPSLCFLFNKSIKSGKLPDEWLSANVIPVHKKSDKANVENYRPISLLCLCSKVLERCLVNSIFTYIKPLIHDVQHGFLKGRSSTTQLSQVFHENGKVLDRAGQVDVLYCHNMPRS